MKILITNPPWLLRRGLSECFGVRAGSRWPFSYDLRKSQGRLRRYYKALKGAKYDLAPNLPTYVPYPAFMGYAAAFLRAKGIDAVFYDAQAQYHNHRSFFITVDKIKPDIVIQETSAPSFELDLKIAKKLHKKYKVCLVGPQATAFAERLANLPYVDYVLKGAYEYPALEMAQTGRRGIYDYNVAQLDDLPHPYRDSEIIHHYRDFNCPKKMALPQLWVYASRGCCFHCDFCLWVHVMFNKELSLRKPENVLNEVDDMAREYDFKHVYFDDDCWNIGGEERLMKMADGMHRIGLPWTINARLDLSSKEMFGYFVDRGCVGLRLGVESVSQRLLDLAHKDLKIETAIDKIRYLEKLDVELYLLFMHYVPGETEIDREDQEREIKKLGQRYQNPPCIPFPGTPYYQNICSSGINLEKAVNWKEYDGGDIGRNLMKAVQDYSKKMEKKTR